MAYSAEIKVGENAYPMASHAPSSVGRKQAAALEAYLERSAVAAKLFKEAVADGEAVTFVEGEGLYIFSDDFGVGGKNHYTLLAEWVPKKAKDKAVSFEAKRVGGEATSFEASRAPRTATIPGTVAATAKKTVEIRGTVFDPARAEALKINRINNALIGEALLDVAPSDGEDPFRDLRRYFRSVHEEASPKEISDHFRKKHPQDLHGNAFLEEILREGTELLVNRSDVGDIARELYLDDIKKWLENHM